MESKIPSSNKTNSLQKFEIGELADFSFENGKLTVGGKTYIVEYFPQGVESGKAAQLTKEQRNQLGNLALKILQTHLKGSVSLNGVIINQKEIKLPNTKNTIPVEKKSEKVFQQIYQIVKNEQKKFIPDDKRLNNLRNKDSSSEENKKTNINKYIDDEDDYDYLQTLESSKKDYIKGDYDEAISFDKSVLAENNLFECVPIKPDGHCFFSSIACALEGNQKQEMRDYDYQSVRNKLSQGLIDIFEKNDDILTENERDIKYGYINEFKLLSKNEKVDYKNYSEAIKNMPMPQENKKWDESDQLWDPKNKDSRKGWGGPLEVMLAAEIYKRPIIFCNPDNIISKIDEYNLPVWNLESSLIIHGTEYKSEKPIYLYYNGANHFDYLSLKK